MAVMKSETDVEAGSDKFILYGYKSVFCLVPFYKGYKCILLNLKDNTK